MLPTMCNVHQPVVVWIEFWIAPKAIVCKRSDFNRSNTQDTKNHDILMMSVTPVKNIYRIYSHRLRLSEFTQISEWFSYLLADIWDIRIIYQKYPKAQFCCPFFCLFWTPDFYSDIQILLEYLGRISAAEASVTDLLFLSLADKIAYWAELDS